MQKVEVMPGSKVSTFLNHLLIPIGASTSTSVARLVYKTLTFNKLCLKD